MNAIVNDIVKIMNAIAPPILAEEWDNVGLLVGRSNAKVSKILVALDLSPQVLQHALKDKVQMIVTHHPVIFKPINNLSDGNWQQELLLDCAENKIAVYSAHTSLDSVLGGVNDVLADLLELEQTCVLVKNANYETGLGRIGFFKKPISLQNFAEKVKKVLKLKALNVIDVNRPVHKVAVCGGAGSDFISEALKAGADTFITGDIKYHEAQQAAYNNLNLIDAGHQGTELPIVQVLADKLALRLTENRLTTQVLTAQEDMLWKHI